MLKIVKQCNYVLCTELQQTYNYRLEYAYNTHYTAYIELYKGNMCMLPIKYMGCLHYPNLRNYGLFFLQYGSFMRVVRVFWFRVHQNFSNEVRVFTFHHLMYLNIVFKNFLVYLNT